MTLPTRLHGKNSRVYCNGVDISGDLRSITPKGGKQFDDISTLGSVGERFWPGLSNDEVDYETLLNENTSTAYAQLKALFGADTSYGLMVVTSGGSQAVGDPVWAANAIKLTKKDVKVVSTSVLWVSAGFKVDNYPFDACKLLQTKAQKTADWTGTTVDNAASSANGAVGYIQLFEQTGGTGCTISIRHSSDNFAADDTELLTFGSWTTNGTLRVTASGTVKRYTRVKGVFAGSGPYTATAAIALRRL